MEWAKALALENKLEELKQLGLIDPGVNYVVVQHKVEKSDMMQGELAQRKAERQDQRNDKQAELNANKNERRRRNQ